MRRLKHFICVIATALLFALPSLPARADEMKIIRDEEIEQTLKTFCKPVWAQAGLSPQTVKIILLENSELNAFVAGGQNIFVHTGLILKTNNPEELIGVLAHESGHIAAGHLFRMQAEIDDLSLQAMLANVLGIAVAIGARAPDAGMAAASLSQTVGLRGILRHSRIQETAADQAGVRFLQDAGLPSRVF